jgi:hypothetical protein
MANATLEAEIREEASTEMAQHLQRLEVMYMKRLQEQASLIIKHPYAANLYDSSPRRPSSRPT